MKAQIQFSLSLIFAFLAFHPLYAQEADSLPPPQHILKTYVINYATLGEVNLAYERLIDHRHSIEFMVGTYWFNWLNEENEDQWLAVPHFGAGFLTAIEFKRYLGSKQQAPFAWFFAPQLLYRQVYFRNIDRAGQFRHDLANITKREAGLKFLFGKQFLLGGPLSASLHFGLGIRGQHRTKKFIYEATWNGGEYVTDYQVANQISYLWYPTLHLGFSLGYVLK